METTYQGNTSRSLGKPGRPEYGPFCSSAWGALSSEKMVERIDKIAACDFGYEYYWVDAGWYGYSTGPCPDEFNGDWFKHTGSWVINETYHPDHFKDVVNALARNHIKFLLWIEPERVLKDTDTPAAHPDWFLSPPDGKGDNLLINYGNEEALQGTLEMISEKDRNLEPFLLPSGFQHPSLPFWRANDEAGRKGITEIKHINGLYKLWDSLLERFPHLIIDNCSSGGRRIDIETLKRSLPLWRSDYQCVWDAAPEATQIHNTGLSWWIPYHGSSPGRVFSDTYRARSGYSSALSFSLWTYDEWDITDEQPLDWVKSITTEYLRWPPLFQRRLLLPCGKQHLRFRLGSLAI